MRAETLEMANVRVLDRPHVRDWVRGRLGFLVDSAPVARNAFLRESERRWGMAALAIPCHERTHWTGPFGESLVRDLLMDRGRSVRRPHRVPRVRVDWETEEAMIEVKTGAYFSQGSAHEKLLGVPFKYIDVPQRYGKPLWIVCAGQAERLSRTVYGNLDGPRTSEAKRALLDTFDTYGIRFVAASSFL